MIPEPVIFLHIPRTGGMSLRKLMHLTYGYHNIGRPWWGEHEGETLTDAVKRKKAWYGHFRFGLHRELDRPVKYITILREPAARLLSEYHRNEYRTRYSMSPVDLAKTERGNNLMVRMLSGALSSDHLTSWHVDRAIENIGKYFVVVGLTERFSELLVNLRKLGWPVFKEPKENEGKKGSTTLDELLEVRRLPELALDYDLYKRIAYGRGN